MAMPTLTPTQKDTPPALEHGGLPPRKNGSARFGGNGGGPGPDGGEPEPEPAPLPVKRPRSPWPFLMDLGLVVALTGLILFRQNAMIVIGAGIALFALFGWLRDARADFRKLSD
jgi:hypothetical protein